MIARREASVHTPERDAFLATVRASAFTVAELPPQWGAAYCVTLLMSDGAERRIALGGAHRPPAPTETAGETAKGARA